MITKHTEYKYEAPYLITGCWANDMVSLQIGATEIRYDIHRIKLYKSDTQVEYFS